MRELPSHLRAKVDFVPHGPYTLADVDARRMSIKCELPPNIDAIGAVFPHVRRECSHRGVYFCYGNSIYNPSGLPLPVELIAHECIHSLQQRDIGVEKWWDRYLAAKDFRLEQELEAHRVEYEKYALDHPARPFRRRYLAMCAGRLSGPLYGHMIRKDEARRLIQGRNQ